ncbi:MAG: hypothetical protein QXI43_00170 [Candidatus Nitrosocaldus sp.]
MEIIKKNRGEKEKGEKMRKKISNSNSNSNSIDLITTTTTPSPLTPTLSAPSSLPPSSPSSSFSSSFSSSLFTSYIEKLITEFIKLIEPRYLAKCIEYNIYIFDSIAYSLSYTKSVEELKQELITQYNINESDAENLVRKSLYMKRIGMVTFRLLHNILRRLPWSSIESKINVDNLERLLYRYHPELYAVYAQYGEQGRQWLHNEIEYDLKPFIMGKKKVEMNNYYNYNIDTASKGRE